MATAACATPAPHQRLPHNVRLALWWSLWENASASVRSGDVLSALLYLTTKSNTAVGLVQGLNGVAQMVTALPAGWQADRHRRDTMLRAGAAVGAVAGAVLCWALAARPSVWALAAAMTLLGCYRGVYSAALEAIFADSVAAGKSSLYTRKYVITVGASSFGPWLSLLLFHFLGNRWEPAACRAVLLCGTAVMVVPLALMCLFDDDRAAQYHALPTQDARATGRQHGPQPAVSADGCSDTAGSRACSECSAVSADLPIANTAAAGLGCNGSQAAATMGGDLASLHGSGGDAAAEEAQLAGEEGAGQERRGGLPAGLVVTLLISCSDLIGALASGMTLRFFSLFFIQVVEMGPMAVSLIGALSPLGVGAASLACQPLSKLAGRVQISLLTRSLDIGLLVTLAYLPTAPASVHGLLVGVHLARMAVANATRPLMRSVLMDFVPRQYRGRVNAVDSVRTFSWSGSAALGGFLIERFGFQRTFLITACIKTAAFLPLFGLLAYVPDGICLPAGSRTARLRVQQQAQRSAGKQAAQRPAGKQAAAGGRPAGDAAAAGPSAHRTQAPAPASSSLLQPLLPNRGS